MAENPIGPQLKVPISKNERIRYFLRTAATADASHDFHGVRAAAGAGEGGESSLFDSIFKRYKDIGTPNELTKEEDVLFTEYEVMDQFMNIFDEKRVPEQRQPAVFREKILKPAEDAGGEAVIGHFYRYAEDEVPYVVTALQIADARGDEGEYKWTKRSEELFAFLNPHEQDYIAFTIDALSVPFYDCLLRDRGPAQTKKAFSLISREGINDAAGKVEILAPKGPVGTVPLVQIETRQDTAAYQVMYPPTDMGRKGELSELELFFSNYALMVSPIEKVSGVTTTTLSITDKSLVRQVQVLKSSKEDRHPNAVPTLSSEIRRLLGLLAPGQGNQKEKALYHALLQQKRSGDWLQNLACLTPERFGLAADTRIMMATNDKICVAYGIFVGVDVLFTYINPSDRTKWLIRFHRAMKTSRKTPEEKFRAEMALFPGPEAPVTRELAYAAAKGVYVDQWNKMNATLRGAMERALQKLNEYAAAAGRFKPADAEKLIKTVLTEATTLCVFRTLAPAVAAGAEVEDMRREEAELETRRAAFDTYKANHMILRRALEAKEGVALSDEMAIALFFKKVFAKNGAGTAAQREREALITKLQIFGVMFNKANGGANGVGIFTFLNGGLDDAEKGGLKAALQRMMGRIGDDRQTAEKYDAFAKTASFLVQTEGEAAAGAAAAAVPTVEEVSTEDLHQAIAGLLELGERVVEGMVGGQGQKRRRGVAAAADDDEMNVEGAGVEGAGAAKKGRQEADMDEILLGVSQQDDATQVSRTFRVSDFGAALAILAARAQRALGGAAGGAAAGGSGSSSKQDHHPLTTFHFLLRELSYRLSDSSYEEDWPELSALTTIVLALLRGAPGTMRGGRAAAREEGEVLSPEKGVLSLVRIGAWDYFSSLEAFLLEGAIDSSSHSILAEVAASIKRGYYGLDTIVGAPGRMVLSKEKIVNLLAEVDTRNVRNRAELIEACIEEMRAMPKRIKSMPFQERRGASSASKTRKQHPAIFTNVTYNKRKGNRANSKGLGQSKLANYRTRKSAGRGNARQATIKVA